MYRQYWALTEGIFTPKHQVFRDKIGRDRHDRRKRIVDQKNGQTALTAVDCLKTFSKPVWSAVSWQLDALIKSASTFPIMALLSSESDPLYSQVKAPRLSHPCSHAQFYPPFYS